MNSNPESAEHLMIPRYVINRSHSSHGSHQALLHTFFRLSIPICSTSYVLRWLRKIIQHEWSVGK
jgi:hypothetical protein